MSAAELEPVSDRDTVSGVHAHLRRLILDGHLQPGSTLSQVQLARSLGVSRTPLREAIRRLQEEGLIVAEVNHRARVVGLNPDELETLYATRILLSVLGLSVSMPRFTSRDLTSLERALADMHQASHDDNVEAWELAHHQFHERLHSHANPSLRTAINRLLDRSDLYRRVGLKIDPHRWTASDEDHIALLAACRPGRYRGRHGNPGKALSTDRAHGHGPAVARNTNRPRSAGHSSWPSANAQSTRATHMAFGAAPGACRAPEPAATTVPAHRCVVHTIPPPRNAIKAKYAVNREDRNAAWQNPAADFRHARYLAIMLRANRCCCCCSRRSDATATAREKFRVVDSRLDRVSNCVVRSCGLEWCVPGNIAQVVQFPVRVSGKYETNIRRDRTRLGLVRYPGKLVRAVLVARLQLLVALL